MKRIRDAAIILGMAVLAAGCGPSGTSDTSDLQHPIGQPEETPIETLSPPPEPRGDPAIVIPELSDTPLPTGTVVELEYPGGQSRGALHILQRWDGETWQHVYDLATEEMTSAIPRDLATWVGNWASPDEHLELGDREREGPGGGLFVIVPPSAEPGIYRVCNPDGELCSAAFDVVARDDLSPPTESPGDVDIVIPEMDAGPIAAGTVVELEYPGGQSRGALHILQRWDGGPWVHVYDLRTWREGDSDRDARDVGSWERMWVTPDVRLDVADWEREGPGGGQFVIVPREAESAVYRVCDPDGERCSTAFEVAAVDIGAVDPPDWQQGCPEGLMVDGIYDFAGLPDEEPTNQPVDAARQFAATARVGSEDDEAEPVEVRVRATRDPQAFELTDSAGNMIGTVGTTLVGDTYHVESVQHCARAEPGVWLSIGP